MRDTLARAAIVVPAAGSGRRVGGPLNKLLQPLAGRPLLAHTLASVAAVGAAQVVVVTRPDEREAIERLADEVGLAVSWADGGASRQESVANGLAALAVPIELVAVHDGARPLAEPALFHAALASAAENGSGVVAVPAVDTLKQVADGVIGDALDRERIWAMQTPQAFRVDWLRDAVSAAVRDGFDGTDEASLVARLGHQVRVVEGTARNLKVTRPDDFAMAAALLGQASDRAAAPRAGETMRIGFGYDVHQLVEGRELWLGGVKIDSPVGLLGHSDADALLHAVCDALLGAIGAGDIGKHFPDTDPAYKGVASIRLLEASHRQVAEAGYRVVNVDATVIAERPRLAPHVEAMRACIAAALSTTPDRISLKATTNERLDDLGAGQGIAAHAVALIERK